ncbi:unnamed protein product [Rotaria socialis]|nr:unnamed protein product [Rotaria socialis]
MIKLWGVLLLFISRVTAGKFPPLDLHIGTGGEFLGAANLPLGAQTLYGTVRLGPGTSNSEDSPAVINRYAGYHYYDSYINIFSHTHVFGAGIVDYGNVGIFPVQVNNDNDLQHVIANKHGYRSTFEHKSEIVEPGYYQVYLDTHKTKVELTATEQVGIHRYSFDDFNEKHRVVLIDSSYALPPYGCQQSHVNINSTSNEITGSVFFKGFLSRSFGGVTTYFVIIFTNWTDFGVWTEGRLLQGETTADGCSSGAYVKLPANQQQVTIYVGISFVSIEQARDNLEIQTKLESFDSIRDWI